MREESEGPITRAYLEQLHIGSGYSAWALAEDLICMNDGKHGAGVRKGMVSNLQKPIP